MTASSSSCLPAASTPIKVGVLGLTNHRVPNYELPSNIPGLSFSDPIEKAEELAPVLDSRNDAVVALTHIGFTEDPKSVEVDKNVDTNLAKAVGGHRRDPRQPQPYQPDHGLGALQVPAGDRGRPDQYAGADQPGLSLQHLPGRGRAGLPADGEGGYEVVSRVGP